MRPLSSSSSSSLPSRNIVAKRRLQQQLQKGGRWNFVTSSPIRMFVLVVVVIWTSLFVVVPWEHRRSPRHDVGQHLDAHKQSGEMMDAEEEKDDDDDGTDRTGQEALEDAADNHEKKKKKKTKTTTKKEPIKKRDKALDGMEHEPFLALGDDDDDDGFVDELDAASDKTKGAAQESADAKIGRALVEKWSAKAQHKSMLRQTRKPPIAWLMSFPNSGTSFTLQFTMVASQQTTATNYADEEGGIHITDFPVYGTDSPSGPFFLQQHQWPYRSGYVLTKTHCAGFCLFCGPQVLLARTRNMRKTCSTGFRLLPNSTAVRQAMDAYGAKVQRDEEKKQQRLWRKDQERERSITLRIMDRKLGKESEYDRDDDDDYYQQDYETPTHLTNAVAAQPPKDTDKDRDNATETTTFAKVRLDGRYDSDLVRKAVHLFRHPLDNIVSRFHHYVQTTNGSPPDLSYLPPDVPPPPPPSSYPDNEVGFRAFCRDVDRRVEAKSTFTDVLEYKHPGTSATCPLMRHFEYRQFPCYSDLFRYVHWHNLAVDLLQEEMSDIPHMVLYYEDYRDNLQGVLQRLLGFLELEQRAEPPPFDGRNKTYQHYFTPEERRIAIRIMAQASTPELWLLLRRYVRELLAP